MLGLAVADLAGVPAATWLGQPLGWRSAYWAVVLVAAATLLAVALFVPSSPAAPGAGVRTELRRRCCSRCSPGWSASAACSPSTVTAKRYWLTALAIYGLRCSLVRTEFAGAPSTSSTAALVRS